jgi:hypothetical protein
VGEAGKRGFGRLSQEMKAANARLADRRAEKVSGLGPPGLEAGAVRRGAGKDDGEAFRRQALLAVSGICTVAGPAARMPVADSGSPFSSLPSRVSMVAGRLISPNGAVMVSMPAASPSWTSVMAGALKVGLASHAVVVVPAQAGAANRLKSASEADIPAATFGARTRGSPIRGVARQRITFSASAAPVLVAFIAFDVSSRLSIDS